MRVSRSCSATEIAARAFAVAVASCSSPPPPVAPVPPVAVAPVVAAPTPAPPAPPAPSASGIWLGQLEGAPLHVQLRLDLAQTPPICAIDSIDQGAFGIPCDHVVIDGASVKLVVPAVGGTITGTISADGKTIAATWTQGRPMKLALSRQATAITVSPRPDDPALPPVALDHLRAQLDDDLVVALATGGDLAPATGNGVAIGVYVGGKRLVLAYGAVKPDSLFEIGSITKTFTGLALAQMVAQHQVALEQPVRELLPAGTVAAPPPGHEIRLVDLSTHHSGLPRMPDNFHPADPDNPYADYDDHALLAYIGAHGVAMAEDAKFDYSNLGAGLLGYALARRAHATYEQLLAREITGPLAMRETVVTMPPALAPRFARGHDAQHHEAHAWELGALAGAGGIRSTASDMLTYLIAQLHPDKLPASARKTAEGKTLAAAIAASHELRADGPPRAHIALNWLHGDDIPVFWHDGATGGFSSYAAFAPDRDTAVVVLASSSGETELASRLGTHILQRLGGTPALSLAPAH